MRLAGLFADNPGRKGLKFFAFFSKSGYSYSRTSYPVSLFGLLFLGRRDRFWISILGFWLSLLVLCPSVGSSRQREKPIESEEKEDGPTALCTVPRARPLASPTETAGRPAVSPSWSGGRGCFFLFSPTHKASSAM